MCNDAANDYFNSVNLAITFSINWSPRWCIQIAGFIWPTVQNPKRLKQMFWIFAWKLTKMIKIVANFCWSTNQWFDQSLQL